jgi:hypothetical protein
MTTNFTLVEADAAEVYRIYRLRDWIEHYYKPVKHELGWADFQVRCERAIVRHWQLVMLAFTFSLIAGTPADPHDHDPPTTEDEWAGEKSTDDRLAGHTAGRAQLAMSLGTPAVVLAQLVDGAPTGGVGGVT